MTQVKFLFLFLFLFIQCRRQTNDNIIQPVESKKFSGSLEDARKITNSYRLAPTVNLNGKQSQNEKNLNLTSDYDDLKTYLHIRDQSQDFLRIIREMICIYSKGDFPEKVTLDEQEHSTKIDTSSCYRVIDSDSNKKRGSQEYLQNIIYNVNLLLEPANSEYTLISKISYVNYRDSTKPQLGTTATFYTIKGSSNDCPLGDFSLDVKITGPDIEDWTNWNQEKAAAYTPTVPTLGSATNDCSISNTKCIHMKVKCNSSNKSVNVEYEENSSIWSGKKYLSGDLYIDPESGTIDSGAYSAIVRGHSKNFDITGGDYLVAFDKNYFLSHRSISSDEIEQYIPQDSINNITYTSQTDKQCRKSNTFNRYVWGYKIFDTNNKISIPQQEQTWLIENKEGTKNGYANYYNIKLYKDSNKNTTEEPSDEEKICHLNYPKESDGTINTSNEPQRNCLYEYKKDYILWTKESLITADFSILENQSLQGYSDATNDYILTYKESKWYKISQKAKDSTSEYIAISPHIELDPSSLPERILLSSITDFSVSYILLKEAGKQNLYKLDVESPFFPQKSYSFICLNNCYKSPFTYESQKLFLDAEQKFSAGEIGNPEYQIEKSKILYGANSLGEYSLNKNYTFTHQETLIELNAYNQLKKEGYNFQKISSFIDKDEYDRLKVDICTEGKSQCFLNNSLETYYLYTFSNELFANGYLIDNDKNKVNFYNSIITIQTNEDDLLESSYLSGESEFIFWRDRAFLHAPSVQLKSKKDPITGLFHTKWLPIISLKDATTIKDADDTTLKLKAYFTEIEMQKEELTKCEHLVSSLPSISVIDKIKEDMD
jgi:hypothetical protein